MTHHTKLIALFTTAAITTGSLLSGVAWAQPFGNGGDDGYESAQAKGKAVDGNHNNFLDRSEVTAELLGVKAVSGAVAPVDAVVGVDGGVWSVSGGPPAISRVVPTRWKGQRIAIPQRLSSSEVVGGGALTVGADGRLVWVAQLDGEQVLARRTVDGDVSVVQLARQGVKLPFSGISDLQAGSDGNAWFAASGLVGYVTPSGRARAFKIPVKRLGYPSAIKGISPRLTVENDGSMVFSSGSGLGRVTAAGRFRRWEAMLPASTTSNASSAAARGTLGPSPTATPTSTNDTAPATYEPWGTTTATERTFGRRSSPTRSAWCSCREKPTISSAR